jgi:hypothetical protein
LQGEGEKRRGLAKEARMGNVRVAIVGRLPGFSWGKNSFKLCYI